MEDKTLKGFHQVAQPQKEILLHLPKKHEIVCFGYLQSWANTIPIPTFPSACLRSGTLWDRCECYIFSFSVSHIDINSWHRAEFWKLASSQKGNYTFNSLFPILIASRHPQTQLQMMIPMSLKTISISGWQHTRVGIAYCHYFHPFPLL